MLPVLRELLYFKMHFLLSHCLFHRAQINDGSDQDGPKGVCWMRGERHGYNLGEHQLVFKGQMNEEKPKEKGQWERIRRVWCLESRQKINIEESSSTQSCKGVEKKMSLAVWQFQENWSWDGNYKQLLTFQEAWWENACYVSSVQYTFVG